MKLINEKIEDHKNSIELSLYSFFENFLKLGSEYSFNDNEKKYIGGLISSALPFNDYIQLTLLLDVEDNKIPFNKVLKLLEKNMHSIENEFINEYDKKFEGIKDKVRKILLKILPKSKELKNTIKENKKLSSYELAKLSKPRIPTTGLPKAGAFDKDTKNILKRKDPYDRKVTKHKGKIMMEKDILEEGVLGFTAMPALMRMQSLAGIETTPKTKEIHQIEKPILENTPEYEKILSLLAQIDELLPHLKVFEFEEFKEKVEELLKD